MTTITNKKRIHPPLSVKEITELVEAQSHDIDVLCAHYKNGTIEKFYTDLITETTTTLMMIPARRSELDLPIIEDADSISLEVAKIAGIIGMMCSIPKIHVERDLMMAVHEFPSEDVRQSSRLRAQHLLN